MHLRGVDVHVVHSGNEQLVAEIDHLSTLAPQVLQVACDTQDNAVFNGDIAILKHLEMILLFREEDMCLINLFHRVLS